MDALLIPVAIILWEIAGVVMAWSLVTISSFLEWFVDFVKDRKKKEVDKKYFIYDIRKRKWVETDIDPTVNPIGDKKNE